MSRSHTETARRFYDRTRAAEMLGESRSTIIREERAGRLTPVRFRPGGKVHYRAKEVDAIAQGVEGTDMRTVNALAAIAAKRKRPERVMRTRRPYADDGGRLDCDHQPEPVQELVL